MKKSVIIVGAGASGMTAAVAAAGNGCRVRLIDCNEKPGKKLLATGNGKCNFTNSRMDGGCFRSETPQFVQDVLEQFGTKETLALMRSLGIEPAVKNGYYYPASGQASSVAGVFEMELRHLQVEQRLSERVLSVERKNGRFQVLTRSAAVSDRQKDGQKQVYEADAVILSCGSRAGIPRQKAAGGYELAEALGHSITPLAPALTGLQCAGGWFKEWGGVRTEGSVSIFEGRKLCASDMGELQLTDYGISGIPVFQVSRYAAMALMRGKGVTAVLDFFPGKSRAALWQLLLDRQRRMDYKSYRELLIGLLPEKLIGVLLRQSDLAPADKSEADGLERLAREMKQFTLSVLASNPMNQAQVCAGGVRLTEIDSRTMESKLVPGLYLTGELLDAEGICGGYNLQWAWATGAIAGKSVSL